MMQSALDPEQFHQGYLGFISQFFPQNCAGSFRCFLKAVFPNHGINSVYLVIFCGLTAAGMITKLHSLVQLKSLLRV